MNVHFVRASIHAKIFAVIALVALALVIGLTTYFARRHADSSQHALENRTRIYAGLLARELEPVVAFDDHETAREVFRSITVDPDVRGVGVFVDGSGLLLESRGELTRGPEASGSLQSTKLEKTPTVLRAIAPITSREGPRGQVVIEVSTASVDAQIASAQRTAAVVALLALAFGMVGAWLIGRSFARRLGRLAKAASTVVSDGATASSKDGSQPFVDSSSDEIGVLADSFNTMVGSLRGLMSKIERDRLEALVAERTVELGARHRDMRLLLDHVVEGFLVVDAQGNVGAEHSTIMNRWFDASLLQKGEPIWRLFEQHDPEGATYLELAWDSLFDDFLPVEVVLDQFPKRLRNENAIFDLVVRPIFGDDGKITSALVVLVDVTASLKREEAETAQRELVALFGRALSDRRALVDFMTEGDALVEIVHGGTGKSAAATANAKTLTDVKRAIHTLKGSAGQLGVSSIAAACHAIEERMADSQELPSSSDRAELLAKWTALTSCLGVLFTSAPATALQIEKKDLDALIAKIDQYDSYTDLARHARLLRLEPVKQRLVRAQDAAIAMSNRLGKEVDVEVSCDERIRCDAGKWGPFWAAFTHVIRNAVDHGIELPELRQSAGKSARGKLGLRVSLSASTGQVIVEVTDDGAGVDWSAVSKRAATYNLPARNREELEEALFADGVTTRENVTDLSGRGVGLGAIRSATESMGGSVSVETTAGTGTTFRFAMPIEVLGDAYERSSSWLEAA